jgi:hypothetical protein
LARHDGQLTAAGEAPFDIKDWLDLMAATSADRSQDRGDAIACFLASGEGWKSARSTLRGRFSTSAAATGLMSGKDK